VFHKVKVLFSTFNTAIAQGFGFYNNQSTDWSCKKWPWLKNKCREKKQSPSIGKIYAQS
jgi:hypothetical protein